jgi:hypothetical protein
MSERTCPPACRGTRRAAFLAIAAAVVLAVSACHASPESPAATAPSATPALSSGPPSGPSTSSTHIYRYTSTQRGCDLLNLDAVPTALGDDAGNLVSPNYEETSVAYFARCDRQYGAPGDRSLASIQIMVVKDGDAQFFYDGLHKQDAKNYTIAEVPSIAAAAYTFTDPQTGPHLTLYDGNCYLRISINQIVHHSVSSSTITGLMSDIARNALAAMAT